MGVGGYAPPKHAADAISLDGSFCSIVTGVEEGRLVFDNLKKIIAFLLSTNLAQLLPFLLVVLVDIPLPLSATGALCIDVLNFVRMPFVIDFFWFLFY